MTFRERAKRFYLAHRRFLYICRLHRPTDLGLLLFIALWSSLLASKGAPDLNAMGLLLGSAFFARCAAWVYNDWMEMRLLVDAQESFTARHIVGSLEALLLLILLLSLSLLLIWPLGMTVLLYAFGALLLLLGFPLLKTRLLLTQPYLGLFFAWIVPMGWVSQGVSPDKATWLMATAVLLWAAGFTTLYAMPRRNYEQRAGIRSLAQLFGDNSWLFVLAMQLLALFTLWMLGRQQDLNLFFRIGLATSLLLLPYQYWLLFSHPQSGPRRSYRSQLWTGLAIACGIGFHFLCVCRLA